MKAPNFILKIIPHVDGSPRICELVRFHLEDITLKEAWTGPAALGLFPHALCDVARLPVREVVSALHFKADLTLGLGRWRSIIWRNRSAVAIHLRRVMHPRRGGRIAVRRDGRDSSAHRTSTFLNCQGSLVSMSSGNSPGRSVSGVQSV